MIIPISLLIPITHTQNMKFNTCMDAKKKKHKHENYSMHTKIRKETTNQVGETFFFCYFLLIQ